ncbi:MAG TPA: hypothetical protein VF335_07210, partial [Chitinivibrionales bacterium]
MVNKIFSLTIFAVSFFCFVTTAQGQWTKMDSLGETGIRAFAVNGDTIFAGTWSGIYRSSNN